tara:strand:+ start:551 stop:718 length:168 start_codon:yes stop_codon:yes gene_type:complete
MNEYNKQRYHWKAKSFFQNILKSEGRKYLISDTSVDSLAEMLSSRLVQKIQKETK